MQWIFYWGSKSISLSSCFFKKFSMNAAAFLSFLFFSLVLLFFFGLPTLFFSFLSLCFFFWSWIAFSMAVSKMSHICFVLFPILFRTLKIVFSSVFGHIISFLSSFISEFVSSNSLVSSSVLFCSFSIIFETIISIFRSKICWYSISSWIFSLSGFGIWGSFMFIMLSISR